MSDDEAVSMRVTSGDPTPEELAAVIAVTSDAYASEVAAAEAVDVPKLSTWMRTRRKMRGNLRRDLDFGSWTTS